MDKIKNCSKKKFVQFIKNIKDYFYGTELCLGFMNSASKFSATEKIDGSYLEIGFIDNKVKVAKNHGELTDNAGDFTGTFAQPYKDILIYCQENLYSKFKYIAEQYGSDFKFKGEFLYSKDAPIDVDGSVTFIATKYDPKKLGEYFTFVLFETQVLNKKTGEYEIMDDEKNLFLSLLLISNEFRFYSKGYIKEYDTVSFENIFYEERLNEILEDPDALLKLSKDDFEQIRRKFQLVFNNYFRGFSSSLGYDDSIVEGLVFDFNGERIAAQNPEWYKLKKNYFRIAEHFRDMKRVFLYNITGFKTVKKAVPIIEQLFKDRELDNIDSSIQRYKNVITAAYEEWIYIDKNRIPKNLSQIQDEFIEQEYWNIQNLNILNVIEYLK